MDSTGVDVVYLWTNSDSNCDRDDARWTEPKLRSHPRAGNSPIIRSVNLDKPSNCSGTYVKTQETPACPFSHIPATVSVR